MSRAPDREIEVFVKASRLPAADRAAYLVQACAGNDDLRQRVEALLRAHDQVGDFMEGPEVPPDSAAGLTESVTERPGDRIGRYKLLEKIGEGGCGVVYMAEQEEPVRRRVALKIVKPGMDTKSVIARFEAERQALALMDHPNIAKVLDAGATNSGRPFFVMELVRGTKITDYCNQHALDTRDRLGLFVQVCGAVEHAHQKGIIHRDLKPSNILVTEDVTSAAMPVVIDFGIAKATMNQRLTDKTLFTAFEMLVGTPAYMSPEQAALTSVDVDTRTDIYSLGVLLYELLTGAPPFDAAELLKAGLDEVRRVIREQEPPRPSSRLSTLGGEALTNVAQQRQAEPQTLISLVRGDLDWIAMRALEKDRTRRYGTATGLALDVQRYLANEVISARPPSLAYQLRKLVARHQLAFASAGVVLALLLASLVIVSSLLAREREARRDADAARRQAESDKARAQAESTKSQQVTRFLEEALRGAGPSVAQGRDTVMLREILDKAAARIRTDLADQPASRAQLEIVIGQVYHQLAAFPQAEVCFRDAVALCRDHPSDDGRQLATALAELSVTLTSQRKVEEALSAANEALRLRRKIFPAESAEIATALLRVGGAEYGAGRYDEAEQNSRAALAIRRRLFGSQSLEVADALNSLSVDLRQRGQYAEAAPIAREAIAIRQVRLGPNHPDVAQALRLLAAVLGDNGQPEESETAYAAAAEIWRRIAGEQHAEFARTQMARGFMLKGAGYLEKAEVVFRDLLAAERAPGSSSQSFLMETLLGFGETLHRRGQLPEAETAMREALSLARKSLPEGHSYVATIADRLMKTLLAQGKGGEAEALLNELLPPALEAQPKGAFLLGTRGTFYGEWGRWEESVRDANKALAYRPTDVRAFELVALVLVASGREEAYRDLCRQAGAFHDVADTTTARRLVRGCLLLPPVVSDFPVLAPFLKLASPDRAELKDPLEQVGQALGDYRQGRYEAAVQWAERALAAGASELVEDQAYPILALARFRLGQDLAAQKSLEDLASLQRARPAWSDAEPSSKVWREQVLSDLLMREAKVAARRAEEKR